MSMYMSFFLRGEDNKFYPIGTYSRNTAIYEVFSECNLGPWEKIEPITEKGIDRVVTEVKNNISGFQNHISDYEKKIDLLTKMENSVEEKMEYIHEYTEYINDYKERIKELEYCKAFAYFISEIIEEYHWDNDKNEEEYVYVGIEIGNPTEEDIC